jgi:hypothetical protein
MIRMASCAFHPRSVSHGVVAVAVTACTGGFAVLVPLGRLFFISEGVASWQSSRQAGRKSHSVQKLRRQTTLPTRQQTWQTGKVLVLRKWFRCIVSFHCIHFISLHAFHFVSLHAFHFISLHCMHFIEIEVCAKRAMNATNHRRSLVA